MENTGRDTGGREVAGPKHDEYLASKPHEQAMMTDQDFRAQKRLKMEEMPQGGREGKGEEGETGEAATAPPLDFSAIFEAPLPTEMPPPPPPPLSREEGIKDVDMLPHDRPTVVQAPPAPGAATTASSTFCGSPLHFEKLSPFLMQHHGSVSGGYPAAGSNQSSPQHQPMRSGEPFAESSSSTFQGGGPDQQQQHTQQPHPFEWPETPLLEGADGGDILVRSDSSSGSRVLSDQHYHQQQHQQQQHHHTHHQQQQQATTPSWMSSPVLRALSAGSGISGGGGGVGTEGMMVSRRTSSMDEGHDRSTSGVGGGPAVRKGSFSSHGIMHRSTRSILVREEKHHASILSFGDGNEEEEGRELMMLLGMGSASGVSVSGPSHEQNHHNHDDFEQMAQSIATGEQTHTHHQQQQQQQHNAWPLQVLSPERQTSGGSACSLFGISGSNALSFSLTGSVPPPPSSSPAQAITAPTPPIPQGPLSLTPGSVAFPPPPPPPPLQQHQPSSSSTTAVTAPATGDAAAPATSLSAPWDRIGEDFQAVLPEMVVHMKDEDQEEEGQEDDEEEEEEEEDERIGGGGAASGVSATSSVSSSEQTFMRRRRQQEGLATLVWSPSWSGGDDADVASTLARVVAATGGGRNAALAKWSPEEVAKFADGLRAYRKNFDVIQRKCLPSRSVKEIVARYYADWKRSPGYREWKEDKLVGRRILLRQKRPLWRGGGWEELKGTIQGCERDEEGDELFNLLYDDGRMGQLFRYEAEPLLLHPDEAGEVPPPLAVGAEANASPREGGGSGGGGDGDAAANSSSSSLTAVQEAQDEDEEGESSPAPMVEESE